MTAAHFENVSPVQVNLRDDVMIKLDAGAIPFVAGHQWDAHRRFFFIGIVEKQNFFAVQLAREKGIPKLPDGLANPADGEQMVNDRHTELLHAGDFGGLTRAAKGKLQTFALSLA